MVKSGEQWPIFIAVAIFGVVVLGYWTIKETMRADLTESNIYMDRYQNVDDNINEILEANIEFDKSYTLKLEFIDLGSKSAKIVYMLTDKSGKPVDDAQAKLVMSRPVSDAEDISLKPTKIEKGKYIFENIHLPKEGRWDLLLEVKAGDKTRYFNLKADTRSEKTFEF